MWRNLADFQTRTQTHRQMENVQGTEDTDGTDTDMDMEMGTDMNTDMNTDMGNFYQHQ